MRPVINAEDISDEDIDKMGDDDCLHCLIQRVVLRYRRAHPEEDGQKMGNEIAKVYAEYGISQDAKTLHDILDSWIAEVKGNAATQVPQSGKMRLN